jgi:RNA recognition motif-containing protein
MGPETSGNSNIFVCNLPPGTSETLLADHFGQIGLVKVCPCFLPLFVFSLYMI